MILHLNTKQSYPTDTPACIWIAFRRTSQTTTSIPPLPHLYKTRSPSHLKVFIFVDFDHPYWHCRVGVLAYSCAVRTYTMYVCEDTQAHVRVLSPASTRCIESPIEDPIFACNCRNLDVAGYLTTCICNREVQGDCDGHAQWSGLHAPVWGARQHAQRFLATCKTFESLPPQILSTYFTPHSH